MVRSGVPHAALWPVNDMTMLPSYFSSGMGGTSTATLGDACGVNRDVWCLIRTRFKAGYFTRSVMHTMSNCGCLITGRLK